MRPNFKELSKKCSSLLVRPAAMGPLSIKVKISQARPVNRSERYHYLVVCNKYDIEYP